MKLAAPYLQAKYCLRSEPTKRTTSDFERKGLLPVPRTQTLELGTMVCLGKSAFHCCLGYSSCVCLNGLIFTS